MSLILDLIFPKKCYGCNKEGQYFCSDCLDKLNNIPIKPLVGSKLEGCLSLFKYKSIIKSALLDLKYGFVTDLTDELVYICISRIKKDYPSLLKYWLDNNFIFIPIPLHQHRYNWRGFNQAQILGENIAAKLGLKYSDQILYRTLNTSAQAKLKDKTDRLTNVSSAFILNSNLSKNLPKNIILFDDVTTTQATLNSAVSAFNFSHENHCWGLTVAG
jgi:ComF family protein